MAASDGSTSRSGGSGSGGGRSGGTSSRNGKGGFQKGRSGAKGSKGAQGSKGGRPSGPDRRSGDRPGRGRPDGPRPRRGSSADPDAAGPSQWGSLGRKGAGRVARTDGDRRDGGTAGRDERPDPGNEPIRWERVDLRDEGTAAVRRGRSGSSSGSQRRGRPPRKAGAGTGGADARDELVRALGKQKGARANDKLRDAAHAFERERFEEARTLLRPLAEAAPQAPSVRELLGLTYYRLGRWSDAVRELEAFRALERTTEQHPVLADCYRALDRRTEVEELWDELREASPSADLVTEGRIVMAGSLADRGDLAAAISLLDRAHKAPKRADVHHLRQAYALADLYERAGEVAKARGLFRWIVDHDAGFADAAERAASLG